MNLSNLPKLSKTLGKRVYIDHICALCAFVIIISSMFVSAANGWDGRMDYFNISGVISRILLVMLSIRFIKAEHFAVKLYGVFFAWIILTRPLCRAIILEKSFNMLFLQALCFSLLLYAASLKNQQRIKLFTAISVVYCLFYFIISLFSVYVAVMHEDIKLPLFIDIGVLGSYVSVLSRNRNFTAQWECIAFCLVLCYVSLKKPKKWQYPIAFVIEIALYSAVAISCSKTSIIALAFVLAMAVVLTIMTRLKNKNAKMRVIVSIVAAIVVLSVSYKGADVVCSGLNRLGNYVTRVESAEISEETINTENDNNLTSDSIDNINAETKEATSEEHQALFNEKRSRERIFSLTQRVDIWRAAIGTLVYEPERIYFGSTDFMDLINARLRQEGINETKSSTHNAFIETLMRTGITGLLLFTIFVVILVARMIAVFFSEKADLFYKMLTIPLAATLIKNMCEASITKDDDVTVFIFFLVAGIFLSYSYELFPEKKLWGRRKGKAQSANDAS